MESYIALIDDDAITNTLHRIILKKQNSKLQFKIFENSEIALHYFIENKSSLPALILLDLNMPILNGWDFLDEFSKNHLHAPIVIVTSSIVPEDKEKAKKYPDVLNFITKPMDLENIPENISKIIDRVICV